MNHQVIFLRFFLFYKVENEEIPSNFYGANIILIPKSDKNLTKQKAIGQNL